MLGLSDSRDANPPNTPVPLAYSSEPASCDDMMRSRPVGGVAQVVRATVS
jgi:hypothetical protein